MWITSRSKITHFEAVQKRTGPPSRNICRDILSKKILGRQKHQRIPCFLENAVLFSSNSDGGSTACVLSSCDRRLSKPITRRRTVGSVEPIVFSSAMVRLSYMAFQYEHKHYSNDAYAHNKNTDTASLCRLFAVRCIMCAVLFAYEIPS